MADRRTHRFYLVQRLTAQDHHRPERGFDGFFGLEYMGSAEFEFGAAGDSLKRIRASKAVVLAAREVNGSTVYFVGPKDGMQAKLDDFGPWLSGEDHPRRGVGPWCKERTYFPEHLAGEATEYMGRTCAWWSLDDDVMWTLTASRAQQLVQAITAEVEAADA